MSDDFFEWVMHWWWVLASIVFGIIVSIPFTYLKNVYGAPTAAVVLAAIFGVLLLVLVIIKKIDDVKQGQKSKLDETIQRGENMVTYFHDRAADLIIKGSLSNDKLLFWGASKLIEFEKTAPENAMIIVDRPTDMSESLIESLRKLIINNSKNRNIKYRFLKCLPSGIEKNENIEVLETNHDLERASLILPSFGMALYCVDNQEDISDEVHFWFKINIASYSDTELKNDHWYRGFLTVPLSLGKEHSYIGIPMKEHDVREILKRITSSTTNE